MTIRQFLCALACLCCAFAVQARDLVSERTYVEDPSGSLTLVQVQQAPQQSIGSSLFTQGFSQSAFWFKLHIDPQALPGMAPTEKLVIRIRPPYQDQVQLFDPLDAADRVRMTGDYFDWADDEYRSLNLNFVIPLGAVPRDVWLRLRTDQSTLSIIEVMTEAQARDADRRQEMATMLYLMVLLLCMGWAAMSYISQRDRLIGRYILREILAIAYALVVLGCFRIISSGWLPVTWVDMASNIVIFVFVSYVIWFDAQLIREFKPNPWLNRLLMSFAAVLPLNITLILLGQLYWANVVTTYVVITAMPLGFLSALSTRAWAATRGAPADEQPVFSKAFLVGLYGTVLLAVFLNRFPVMGIMDAHESFLYLNLVYALLSSVAMMLLIQVRANRLSKRQQITQNRVAIAELEAEQERAQRVEQSNFLKMLAHEMKTPLSVVRMAAGNYPITQSGTASIHRAVNDMNGIIERLLQVERLQDRHLVIQREAFDLVDLVRAVALSQPEGHRVQIEAGAPIRLQSDQALVRTIVANLLDNALKYSPANSRVHVVLTEHGHGACITVENTIGSAGVPDPDLVFDKYYRSDRAHERTGSGLGLYLVHELLKLLGGRVRYETTGEFVRFSVEFPDGAAQPQ